MIRRTSVASIIRKLIASILYSLLIIHFLVLFVYQLPANPISHRFKIELENYISPHFSQKWSLFSPNPANSNQTIQVRFITYKRNKANNSDWIDIVTPLLNEKNNNFWTPTQRPLKFLNSCASNIVDLRIKIWESETKKAKTKIDTLGITEKMERYIVKSQGHFGVVSYSKTVYNKLYENNSKPDSVLIEYKIIDAFFPRFSKREQDYFSEKNYRFNSLWIKPTRLM